MAIILINGSNTEVSDTYSCKDYTGMTIEPNLTLNGSIIYQSCFSQETPDTEVFPSDMTGVTFINCNLDNVLMPSGNTIIGGTHRRFQAQEDGLDWELDVDGNPLGVLNGA